MQSLPRPMLNSTGVRYPLLFCSKLSKTVSSCSVVSGSSLWSLCKDKRTNKLEAKLKSSLYPCHPQLWPTAMCPFSTASCPGCDSLPVELSDDTNTCVEPLICWFFPLLDYSTRTSEREFQVILFTESSTCFLPYYRTTVSSSLPASLHSCSEVTLPASSDHCCSRRPLGTPGTSSISLAREGGQTCGYLDAVPSFCRS